MVRKKKIQVTGMEDKARGRDNYNLYLCILTLGKNVRTALFDILILFESFKKQGYMDFLFCVYSS